MHVLLYMGKAKRAGSRTESDFDFPILEQVQGRESDRDNAYTRRHYSSTKRATTRAHIEPIGGSYYCTCKDKDKKFRNEMKFNGQLERYVSSSLVFPHKDMVDYLPSTPNGHLLLGSFWAPKKNSRHTRVVWIGRLSIAR